MSVQTIYPNNKTSEWLLLGYFCNFERPFACLYSTGKCTLDFHALATQCL